MAVKQEVSHRELCEQLVQTVLSDHPDTLAIYLFGSWGTEDEWPDSDIDMAVLLPQ